MKKIFIVAATIGTAILLAGCGTLPADNAAKTTANQTQGIEGKIHGHADETKGEIAPAALYQKMQQGEKLVLLDVREAAEYEEAHIPGTTNRISVKELNADTLKQAGITPDQEIIVYCRSGNRSKTASKILRDLGYTNVLELNSGIVHWMEDGLPTESGTQLSAATQQTAGQTQGPKIAFDRLSYDFGEVKQLGGTVQTTFKVRNGGASPLVIGDISTSCSCTSAKLDRQTIAPNGEATLTVIFNPNLHEEPKEKFKRTIFIPTNDPQNPDAELTVWVDILEGQ